MAYELNAVLRKEMGTRACTRLRRQDQIPAVVYAEGKPGTNLAIPAAEWKKLLAKGQRVVTLKLPGGDKQALIKDVQYDALGEATVHVDFSELREGQTVRVAVAVTTKGVPKGQVDGGVLSQAVHTVHIECQPQHIPEKIVVDVEPLMVDDVIHVKDLKLPEGVKAVDAPDIVLIAVHMPRVEEVAATPVEGAPAEPEVITAKKEEEPAEGEAADAKGGEKKKEEKKKEEKK